MLEVDKGLALEAGRGKCTKSNNDKTTNPIINWVLRFSHKNELVRWQCHAISYQQCLPARSAGVVLQRPPHVWCQRTGATTRARTRTRTRLRMRATASGLSLLPSRCRIRGPPGMSSREGRGPRRRVTARWRVTICVPFLSSVRRRAMSRTRIECSGVIDERVVK